MNKIKLNLFVKETIARLKGDTATVTATKNHRTATAGIQCQLAALKAEEVKAEMKAEKAEETLKAIKFPDNLIENTDSYVRSVFEAEDAVEEAKENIEAIRKSIARCEALLKEYDSEVAE